MLRRIEIVKNHHAESYFRAGIFIALLLGVGCLIVWETTARSPIFAQSRDEKTTKRTPPSRDNSNLVLLNSLLLSEGVSVRENVLLPSRVENSTAVLVRLESDEKALLKNGFLAQMPQKNSLSLLERHPDKGGLARQRSLELSPQQILVVAVDQNKQTLWWSLMPDPRVFHAEAADDSGKLSGQTLYRPSADMLVAYPADKAITELRLYHPNWDGARYDLLSLGNLVVR
jgi:hypothetical protein